MKKKLPFFYANFQCGRYNVFKICFFPQKKLKKPSSKVAHNRPKKMLGTSICSLICGHVAWQVSESNQSTFQAWRKVKNMG